MRRSCFVLALRGVLLASSALAAAASNAGERLQAFEDADLILVASDASAADEGLGLFNPESPFATGDWGGLRTELNEHGVTWMGSVTQFYQGNTHGGIDEKFRYGGKVDQFLHVDGHKLGLWQGFLVDMHTETRFGQDANFDAVGLAPVNANMLYPLPGESETAITGLLLTQALSEEWLVTAGKFNLFDLFYQLYPQTGRGVDGFMNASAFLPMTTALGLNLSVMGVGVTKLQEGKVQASFSVLDTHNSSTTSGFSNLYDDGVVMIGMYRLYTEAFGLPGSHSVMGIYGNSTYTSVDINSWAFVPDVGIVAGTETGTWNGAYFFEQKLWVDSKKPQRNVGLLSMWGISDGNPNPIQWSGNVALQGSGFIDSRPLDSLGVAFFYTGLSSDFKQLASPLIEVENPYGGEVYYNFGITPWFHLTTDFQVVNPGETSNDTAVVVGLRGKLDL